MASERIPISAQGDVSCEVEGAPMKEHRLLRGEAKTQAKLFELAAIPTSTTGKKAINALLAAGEIERIGKGGRGDEYCYFMRTRK